MHKLGIMGGSFDPIHLGHIYAAESARMEFSLEEVIFVTAYCPPHKSMDDLAPAQHRVTLVELAIQDYPFFQSSRIEFERGCYSYAGDTINAFKNKYGKDWQIFFITGLDAILNIINWDNARTYPGICNFIAVVRPGYDVNYIRHNIPDEFRPYITILEVPGTAVSSTQIRELVKRNESITGLVAVEVEEYINRYSLYRD